MKKTNYLFFALLTYCLAISCEDSVSEEFEDINGNVEEKLIKSITVISAQDSEENKNIVLSYDTNGRLNTITDGVDTSIFVYNNGELETITGQNDNLSIEELYESPYDAFETGQVLEYDDNGNPYKILFFDQYYDHDINDYVTVEFTATITYDNTPNPYFFTLKSAGIISVLDGVQLNFSLNPQVPEIVQARALFPVNNPSQIIYKDENGDIIYSMNVNYVYDSQNYPTSATVTAVSVEDNETSTYTSSYEYVN